MLNEEVRRTSTMRSAISLPGSVRLGLTAGLLGFLLVLCLGSEYLRHASLPWQLLNRARAEVFATFQGPDVQWLVVISVSVYFVGFLWLLHSDGGALSLIPGVALFSLAAFAYARDYDQAAANTDALVLLFSITLFFGLRFWRAVELKRIEPFNVCGVVAGLMLVLLSIASLWHPESVQNFQYRGQPRWNGLWENPNTFGVLMGVGVLLAIGRAVSRPKSNFESPGSAYERRLIPAPPSNEAERKAGGMRIECRTSGTPMSRSIGKAWQWTKIVFLLAAAGTMSVGLVKSYSRGAWVATAVGLAYLAWELFCHEPNQRHEKENSYPRSGFSFSSCASWLRRNWLPIWVVLLCLLVLAFWNFRYTERLVGRRALSVANVNDFSWRNRVAAYHGSLQMMASRPLFGVGWNLSETVYDQFYRTPKLAEGAAIQLNDYFTLGTALGIPALACFVAHIVLSLFQKPEAQPVRRNLRSLNPGRSSSSSACRAGALILLIGFWFDGGLFKLATGATFWILIGLGKPDCLEALNREAAGSGQAL